MAKRHERLTLASLAILVGLAALSQVLAQAPTPAPTAPASRSPTPTAPTTPTPNQPATPTPPLASIDDFKLDRLVLKDGTEFEGVIVSETAGLVRFKIVLRRPGARTQTIDASYESEEIDRIERLPLTERQQATAFLERLATAGLREAERVAAVTLTDVPAQDGLPAGRRYEGRTCRITSDAEPETLRLIAVRLEELLLAAATRFELASDALKPIEVVVLTRWEDYAAWQRRRRLRILNPACYDPQRKELVAVCELDRLAAELNTVQQRHKAKLAELDDYEAKLRRHFGSSVPFDLIARSRDQRLKVLALAGENEALFERMKASFFAVLFHEALHALVDTAVYPTASHALPRWLNEGLAQMFETVVLEAGAVRWGKLDAERLQAAKEMLKRGELPSLESILRDDPRVFQVGHLTQTLRADRYFVAAWALSHWLVIHRTTPLADLDRYARIAGTESDKVAPFTSLVGMPLPAIEAEWHEWLKQVRPDSSVDRKAGAD
ncbi:MAG TPA: DUF1570 domain-containing protein [Gemmatales bacterium]|nr:DUF1570 domain-containing protein [Gemmatales bacterium]